MPTESLFASLVFRDQPTRCLTSLSRRRSTSCNFPSQFITVTMRLSNLQLRGVNIWSLSQYFGYANGFWTDTGRNPSLESSRNKKKKTRCTTPNLFIALCRVSQSKTLPCRKNVLAATCQSNYLNYLPLWGRSVLMDGRK